MSIIYKWLVTGLESEGANNIVKTVHYKVEGANTTHFAYIGNSVQIEFDSSKPFSDYQNLTEDQVIGWIKQAIGDQLATSYEHDIAIEIQAKTNPIQKPGLPWSN